MTCLSDGVTSLSAQGYRTFLTESDLTCYCADTLCSCSEGRADRRLSMLNLALHFQALALQCCHCGVIDIGNWTSVVCAHNVH